MANCGSTYTATGEPCGLPAGWGSDHDQWCKYHVEEELAAADRVSGEQPDVVELDNLAENERYTVIGDAVYLCTHDPDTDEYTYRIVT